MRDYTSRSAPLMREFEQYQLASGRWSEHYNKCLTTFDRYCAANYSESIVLTQEMIDSWCVKRETEVNNSCRARIYPVVSFVRYLQRHGLTDVKIPTIPRNETRTYIPHAFTARELLDFFKNCDTLCSGHYWQNIRRLTLPVFFRLLYSSGIRTTEARLLRTSNVDLEHGVLDIKYSKGHDQHYIVLHDTMLQLMREYDKTIRNMYPDRLYFFPAKDGKCHTNRWVSDNFKMLWERSSNASAVPYEFRHNYAIENINSWQGDGFDFNRKLHSLSKSMGHGTIESTKYYYSLVPRLAEVMAECTNEDEVIPEVPYAGC